MLVVVEESKLAAGGDLEPVRRTRVFCAKKAAAGAGIRAEGGGKPAIRIEDAASRAAAQLWEKRRGEGALMAQAAEWGRGKRTRQSRAEVVA